MNQKITERLNFIREVVKTFNLDKFGIGGMNIITALDDIDTMRKTNSNAEPIKADGE